VAAAELLALVEAAVVPRAWRQVVLPVAQASPEAVLPSVCRQDLFLPWPVP
jgi:hypothetical protein